MQHAACGIVQATLAKGRIVAPQAPRMHERIRPVPNSASPNWPEAEYCVGIGNGSLHHSPALSNYQSEDSSGDLRPWERPNDARKTHNRSPIPLQGVKSQGVKGVAVSYGGLLRFIAVAVFLVTSVDRSGKNP